MCWRPPAAPAHLRSETMNQSHDHHSTTRHAPEPGTPHEHDPEAAGHVGHGDHAGHVDHAGHGGHAGHGDHVSQFRRLFWIMLVLAVPVVAFSGMFAMILGYELPDAPWVAAVSPVLGTVMYAW